MTVTDETWTWPELHLIVRQIRDDPRTGRHTSEVTQLDRGERDPSLFKAPEGISIEDQNPPSQ